MRRTEVEIKIVDLLDQSCTWNSTVKFLVEGIQFWKVLPQYNLDKEINTTQPKNMRFNSQYKSNAPVAMNTSEEENSNIKMMDMAIKETSHSPKIPATSKYVVLNGSS